MKLFKNHLSFSFLILSSLAGVQTSHGMWYRPIDVPPTAPEVTLKRELQAAVSKGDIDEVQKYLTDPKAAEAVNLVEEKKRYANEDHPLLVDAIAKATDSFWNYAADRGTRLNIIKLLIEAGAKINQKLVGPDRTALEYAVGLEHPASEIIQLLLENGAEVTEQSLHLASRKSEQILNLLKAYQAKQGNMESEHETTKS